jgi:hypothetical protein
VPPAPPPPEALVVDEELLVELASAVEPSPDGSSEGHPAATVATKINVTQADGGEEKRRRTKPEARRVIERA